MSLEDTLASWTGPSSDSEKDRQERTERMVREAVKAHEAFADCDLIVYAKGSYPNNTNVRIDSDVDVAAHCRDVVYWGEHTEGAHPPSTPYKGPWTPAKLRSELVAALQAKFPGQVDTSGSTAIHIDSSTARVDADVVPCFTYKYYFASGTPRRGTRIFTKAGNGFENYPDQHLEKGKTKNANTSLRFKKTVRIMKRVANAMAAGGVHAEVPSYFVECLVYNCPNHILKRSTWVDTVKGTLFHIWNELDGAEPTDNSDRWLEVSECKYLFTTSQKWSRPDGRAFAKAAWNYLELGS